MIVRSRSLAWVPALLVLIVATPAARANDKPRTINLIPMINLDKDVVKGQWRLENGSLVSDNTQAARVRIPYEPPAEYDYHIVFVSHRNDIAQFVRYSGHPALLQIGAWGNTIVGFSYIDGKGADDKDNPTTFRGKDIMQNGREYSVVIQVRRKLLVVSLNGKVISRSSVDPARFTGLGNFWEIGENGLGIGSNASATKFSVVEVREISGPGKLSPRPAPSQAPARPAQEPANAPPGSIFHIDQAGDDTPTDGPAVRPALQQTSIKCLEVNEADSGMMLGQTSEVTLTLSPDKSPRKVGVEFVTPIGNEMSLARDDAMRFVRLKYPNWKVGRAEITFEDKYVPHDGGSIGAAVGTMVMSTIEGFAIDPNAAITGDISANGKVHAIGGVSAKLQGAIADKCTVVAMPNENYDQLVDAVIYGGPALVSNVQIIGISNLADAVATVRTDRDAKLKEAIDLFASLQREGKDNPHYFRNKAAQATLARILELAPQHLSAKLLLDLAQDKVPTTLSVTASHYYTVVAVYQMLGILSQRANSGGSVKVPSTALREGLLGLKKLRPIANKDARPFIDAWARFISAWDAAQEGSGSARSVEAARQGLLDEMDKEQMNADLMQKTLKEGV